MQTSAIGRENLVHLSDSFSTPECTPPRKNSPADLVPCEHNHSGIVFPQVMTFVLQTVPTSLASFRVQSALGEFGVVLEFETVQEQSDCYDIRALLILEQPAYEKLSIGFFNIEETIITLKHVNCTKCFGIEFTDKNGVASSGPSSSNLGHQNGPSPERDPYLVISVKNPGSSTESLRKIKIMLGLYDPDACIKLGILNRNWFVFKLINTSCLLLLLSIRHMYFGGSLITFESPSDSLIVFLNSRESIPSGPLVFFYESLELYVTIGFDDGSNNCNRLEHQPCEWQPLSQKRSGHTDIDQADGCFNRMVPEYRIRLESNPCSEIIAKWEAKQAMKNLLHMDVIPYISSNLRGATFSAGNGAAILQPLNPRGLEPVTEREDAALSRDSDSEPPVSRFSEPFLDFSESSQGHSVPPRFSRYQPRHLRHSRGLKVHLEQKVLTTVKITNAEGVTYRQVLEEDNIWEFKL